MSINCAIGLRWDSTPEQQRALGAALWRWCHRAARNVGMYPYLDNQALSDLLAGRLSPSGATGGTLVCRMFSSRFRATRSAMARRRSIACGGRCRARG
jgi:hypothetical protein